MLVAITRKNIAKSVVGRGVGELSWKREENKVRKATTNIGVLVYNIRRSNVRKNRTRVVWKNARLNIVFQQGALDRIRRIYEID